MRSSSKRSGIPGRLLLLVLLLLPAFLLAAPAVQAQYRGGRRPPKQPLQRNGLLFVEAGWYNTVPGHDFSSETGGAAEEGDGIQLTVGTWLSPRVTGEFEVGHFSNRRYSEVVPYTLQRYDNITGMEFQSGYWQAQVRYHLNVKRRLMPFLLLGAGRISPSFDIHFTVDGLNRVYARKRAGWLLSGGLGLDIVVGQHAAVVLEWRWKEWFGDWFIPGAHYWQVQRTGAGLAWHF